VDLVTFLRERLDEREATAREATEGPWRWVDPGGKVKQALVSGFRAGEHRFVLPVASGDIYPSKFDAAHIALNDPQFVLDDVAAKRRIVEAHADPKHYCAPGPIDRDGYSWYEAGEKRWADIPCLHLRLLAAPFAQHPDFDPSWATEGTVTT
jgi:hypothetical protein